MPPPKKKIELHSKKVFQADMHFFISQELLQLGTLIAQSRNTYVKCTSYTVRTYVPNLASK